MKYIVAKTIRTVEGDLILREGDALERLKIGQHDFYGKDKKNRFWTDEFLSARPREFVKCDR